MRTLILVAVAALAFGSAANAKNCKDPATGKFVRCPAAATAPAATAKTTPAPMASKTTPRCVKGKLCGNSCIAVSKECHKPPT
ncbi:MAG: hypothetical protein M3T55_00560 [Pseudomonadota bacterium]|nr:hypothetical protein [Pseudomonadota bacterium]